MPPAKARRRRDLPVCIRAYESLGWGVSVVVSQLLPGCVFK